MTHIGENVDRALAGLEVPQSWPDTLPLIKELLRAYGPERLMWGSDCPYQLAPGHSYKASIALIRDRLDGVSEGDREWLLRKTAERVFFS